MNQGDLLAATGEPYVLEDDPADGAVRWLGELARVELKPGDIVVLMTQMRLSDDRMKGIAVRWNEMFPDIKCIVLHEGMRLGVLSPEKADATGADAA